MSAAFLRVDRVLVLVEAIQRHEAEHAFGDVIK